MMYFILGIFMMFCIILWSMLYGWAFREAITFNDGIIAGVLVWVYILAAPTFMFVGIYLLNKS